MYVRISGCPPSHNKFHVLYFTADQSWLARDSTVMLNAPNLSDVSRTWKPDKNLAEWNERMMNDGTNSRKPPGTKRVDPGTKSERIGLCPLGWPAMAQSRPQRQAHATVAAKPQYFSTQHVVQGPGPRSQDPNTPRLLQEKKAPVWGDFSPSYLETPPQPHVPHLIIALMCAQRTCHTERMFYNSPTFPPL